jgi:hypothetical protein
MAESKNPYLRNWNSYDYIKSRYLKVGDGKPLPLSTDEATLENTVWITSDGKVVANGFVDQSAALEFYLKDADTVRFSLYESANSDKVYDILTEDSYTFSGFVNDFIQEGFKVIDNPVTEYDVTERGSFTQLNKKTKQSVLGTIGGTSRFNYHFTGVDGAYHAMPHIEGSWFQAFNMNVGIKPRGVVDNVRGVIVIKTGEYYYLPKSPAESLLAAFSYSTGTSGNMHLYTLSLPDTLLVLGDDDVKEAKIPRQTNTGVDDQWTGQATPSIPTPFGTIGVAKNGVFFTSYRTDPTVSYSDQGYYHDNWYGARKAYLNAYNADLSEALVDSGNFPLNTYHYKAAPTDLYDTENSTDHSPLLGFAFDGSPIYGPYGYSGSTGQSNTIKRMEPSYRFKPLTNRPNGGPDYDGLYPSGYFVEDFEYVIGLGDLDDHNGRFCRTPHHPTGVFAYFTTVDEAHHPMFPYVIGDNFYGNVEMSNYGVIVETESQLLKTEETIGEVDLDLWEIFGIKYTTPAGLKKEHIAFVSPHESRTQLGVFLTTGELTGYTNLGVPVTHSGAIFKATGDHKMLGEAKDYSIQTSHLNTFGPARFSGGMRYSRTDPDTQTTQTLYAPQSITGTDFYKAHTGYKTYKDGDKFEDRVYKGHWDGVIPSGVPFKVEVWSFDGTRNGYDGQCLIFPIDGHPAVDGKGLYLNKLFIGEGDSPRLAYEDMVDQAQVEFRKDVDTFLVNSGIIPPSKKLKKFKNIILKESLKT